MIDSGRRRLARRVGLDSFGFVMATGIVSTAAAGHGARLVSDVLLWITSAGYAVLAVLVALRLCWFGVEVIAELATPTRAFGALTLVAGSAVLGERLYSEQFVRPAAVLLAVAALGWLLLGYAVPAFVVLGPVKPGLTAVNGSWLLWVVATQAVSTGASLLARSPAGWPGIAAAVAVITWGVGVVLYLALLALVLVRLLVGPVAPTELTGPYWIIMGATAITVLAGGRILTTTPSPPVVLASTPVVEGVSLVLWAFGTWSIPLLVLFGFWRHVWWRDRLTYRTELWAVVFPLGMYATACDEFGAVSGLDFMVAIGRIVFWIALCAWFAVFAAMLVTVPGRWSGPHADR